MTTHVGELQKLYVSMLKQRRCEERLAELVEAGEVRTPCHLYIGQEAIAAGVCGALNESDYVWGGHRSHGHYLAKGGDLGRLIAEIFGRASGCSKGRGGSMHLFAGEVGILGTVPLVGATIPLAVGAGLAAQLRKDGRVSVAFFGDGATEEGHCYEAMNLAALYRLPVLFVCENNFYASHLHLLERRREDSLQLGAESLAIPSIRLDGNDVEVIYAAATEAVERARRGDGPTFLECRTYRWRGHVGASYDEDVGVKRKDELGEWLPKDPIARAKRALLETGIDPDQLNAVDDDILREVEKAVEFARASDFPESDDLDRHLFV